ncbi:GGDEF domain-containing protein [Arenimonas donghaensis]|uniref:diguanylate cyclase n=1 Tax=Arenimonas donghaensis DSM 18148 = HO3-R19 TaxID=1121014 RepID=A0A087MKF6_9GAMM|nr:diguanylate cyclase [Arenimonas donghaensis]KFL37359.1 hypothetical protein N788_10185 [Arenimonas donghaensis DSM 18148 = HO3-R19]
MTKGEDTRGQAIKQLAMVNRVARIALQDLSVRPMLQRIVDALAEEFDWEFVACARIDAARGEFVCEAVRSDLRSEIRVGYRRALGSGVVGECAVTGRTFDIEDARTHANMVDTLGGTLSELCVPVVHNGEVLAVLNAESRRLAAFRGQRVLLETVADQVAGILRAAALLEELQQANQTLRAANLNLEGETQRDELTGIANRRGFDRRLGAALAEGLQSGQPLALLLVDVDYFKAYNDSLGHPAGDACLGTIAGLLAEVVQDSLVTLARYGGEEFALIAPGASLTAATDLAGRLRRKVEARAIPHPASPLGWVTVSIGVALASPGDTGPQLVQRADTLLYEAKRGGRNRVACERLSS